MNFGEVRETWNYFATKDTKYTIHHADKVSTKIDNRNYTATAEPIELKPKQTYNTYTTESYTFTKEEEAKEQQQAPEYTKNAARYFKENKQRWQGYLDKTFDQKKTAEFPEYQNALVKSIETINTNWRSAAGAFKHDGIVPSMSYKWFIGMWAWDSWKADVATADFNPELAKNNMRALFDYQIQKDDTVRPQDAGAIIDAVFTIKTVRVVVKVATGMNEILNHHWLHGQFGIFIKKPKIRNFKRNVSQTCGLS